MFVAVIYYSFLLQSKNVLFLHLVDPVNWVVINAATLWP